jgi:16S rRNA G527 N7-methylase RsmG
MSELLAKWNRKTNLTSLDVAPASADAIDRLIVEPLIAAQELTAGRSRGHRPGLRRRFPRDSAPPLAARHGRLTMVEVREKKAAFLREAIRVTALEADVVVGRDEELPLREARVITARAIKLNDLIEAVIVRTLSFARPFFFWLARLRAHSRSAFRQGCRNLGKFRCRSAC